MTAPVPSELVRDAIARIEADGRLTPVTAAMQDWLAERADAGRPVVALAALPLSETDRAHLHAGHEVVMVEGGGRCRLRIVAAAGAQWLQVVVDEARGGPSAELSQAARARLLANYAGGLAHDLNNHLGGVLGLSAQLRPFVGNAEDLKLLDGLESATRIGSRLVGVLARMLVRGLGERRDVAAADVLADVLALLGKSMASQGIALQVDAGSGLPAIRTVPVAATQALMQGLSAVAACGPHALELRMSAANAHIGDGRSRSCVVLSCSAHGLPAPCPSRLQAILGADRGMLQRIAEAPDWLEGLAAAALIQRRLGGDLVATTVADGQLRLDYVWPVSPRAV